MITFALEHPVLLGAVIGGCLSGGFFGIVGWAFGYDTGLRDWTRSRVETHRDVPALPPVRDRRFVGGDASWGGR
jgi:hypothetical protein